MNIISIRKFIRLKPFNAETEQGRSDERYRLALLSAIANLFSRGAAMIVMVMSVRLTLPYLGPERFGVWMTITSLLGMFSFLDLGVGNALTNRVSKVATQNNAKALQQTISGGLGFLFAIGFVTGALLLALTKILPSSSVLNIKENSIVDEANTAMGLFAILFGFSLFTNGIQRVFAGLQEAFHSHLISLTGSIISIIALWQLTKVEASIPYLMMATIGIQINTNLILLMLLKSRKLLIIKGMLVNIKIESKHLFRNGILFFILQIGAIVGLSADNLIIANVLGVSQVAMFNVAQKMYQFVTIPINIINNSLWGAYGDAYARGDKRFIKETLRKSMALTASISIFGGITILLFGKYISSLLTKEAMILPPDLLFAFFIWTILEAIGNAFSMFLNGIGEIDLQVKSVISFVMLVIPLKIILTHFGLPYLMLCTIVSYIIAVPILYFLCRKKLILNMQ